MCYDFDLLVCEDIDITVGPSEFPIYAFAGYLFRTDAAQLNTNSRTGSNFVLFHNESEPIIFTGDIKKRKEINALYRNKIKEIISRCKLKEITTNSFLKHFRTGIVYVSNGSDVIQAYNNDMQQTITEKMKMILEKIEQNIKVEPICCVCHVDQTDIHFHVTYVLNETRGKKPSLIEMCCD